MRLNEIKSTAPVPKTSALPAAEPSPPQVKTPSGPRDALALSPLAQVQKPATLPKLPDPALPRPMSHLGGTDYYRLRADDFKRRHPDLPVPSYYMGYGDKYINRFTNELGPKLSPGGQAWLARARLNLQVAIEDLLKKDPAAFDRLERDDEAFKEFAYDSHPKAYFDAGLERLPLKDLVKIGCTPDVRDLLNTNGLEQIAEVAAGLAARKAREYLKQGLTWRLPKSPGEG